MDEAPIDGIFTNGTTDSSARRATCAARETHTVRRISSGIPAVIGLFGVEVYLTRSSMTGSVTIPSLTIPAFLILSMTCTTVP